jgi:hypothetical protein
LLSRDVCDAVRVDNDGGGILFHSGAAMLEWWWWWWWRCERRTPIPDGRDRYTRSGTLLHHGTTTDDRCDMLISMKLLMLLASLLTNVLVQLMILGVQPLHARRNRRIPLS